ncbi:hypothetical protein BT63DRAFT_92255 [Microthyrium microscopicum]|uniref:Uncharacterized protein n=1 Tax=Microthyrium microscopicum TaxID=703497 RepID=A0A6A6U0V7_9PEZI|nr:hypothetical protein BT63DRAFT_92255 [Microthyrium microscopicum]
MRTRLSDFLLCRAIGLQTDRQMNNATSQTLLQTMVQQQDHQTSNQPTCYLKALPYETRHQIFRNLLKLPPNCYIKSIGFYIESLGIKVHGTPDPSYTIVLPTRLSERSEGIYQKNYGSGLNNSFVGKCKLNLGIIHTCRDFYFEGVEILHGMNIYEIKQLYKEHPGSKYLPTMLQLPSYTAITSLHCESISFIRSKTFGYWCTINSRLSGRYMA